MRIQRLDYGPPHALWCVLDGAALVLLDHQVEFSIDCIDCNAYLSFTTRNIHFLIQEIGS